MRSLFVLLAAALCCAVVPAAQGTHEWDHYNCDFWRGSAQFDVFYTQGVPCPKAQQVAWAATRDSVRKNRRAYTAYGYRWTLFCGTDGALIVWAASGSRWVMNMNWSSSRPFTTSGYAVKKGKKVWQRCD